MQTNSQTTNTQEQTAPEITIRVEPPEQGGAAYLRCEGCSREVIGTDESRLSHREGCQRGG